MCSICSFRLSINICGYFSIICPHMCRLDITSLWMHYTHIFIIRNHKSKCCFEQWHYLPILVKYSHVIYFGIVNVIVDFWRKTNKQTCNLCALKLWIIMIALLWINAREIIENTYLLNACRLALGLKSMTKISYKWHI